MQINSLLDSINRGFSVLTRQRHSWLILFSAFLLFTFFHKMADRFFGDGDGVVSGHLKYLTFDINIIIGICFILACYYKSRRIGDISINRLQWIILIAFAYLIRMFFAQLGHNFDLESYEIVADIVLNGDSVYGNTERYNYGPVWAYMLAGIKFLSSIGGYSQKTFHIITASVLFLAELWFFKQLYRHYRQNLMIVLLLFNPVSLVIIGHHSQFDIIAIAIAFSAYNNIRNNKIIAGIFLLALSYCTKHIMVFLPLMLLFDTKISLKNRLLILIVPALIFAASFIPFLSDVAEIQKNVLAYQFNNNQTFLKKFFDLLIPGFIIKMGIFKIIPVFQGYKLLWLFFFPFTGYFLYKKTNEDVFLIYLICIVATSLAVSEQYFLIPLAAVFHYRKYLFSWFFLAAASYYILFVSYNNTSQYFNLKSLGIAADFEWYQLGAAQVQLCLILLLAGIFYRAFKKQIPD